jgi:hypothetical protein
MFSCDAAISRAVPKLTALHKVADRIWSKLFRIWGAAMRAGGLVGSRCTHLVANTGSGP